MKILIYILISLFMGLAGSRAELDNQCLNCFNIDYDKAIWLKQEQLEGNGPGNIPTSANQETTSDLFGFSLALGDNKVYIGAPGFGDTGNVFQCPISFDRSITSRKSPKALCSDTKLNSEFRKRGKFEARSNRYQTNNE